MSDHLIVMRENNIAYNAKYSYQGIKHLFPNFCGDEVAAADAGAMSPAAIKHPLPEDPHTHSQDVLEHPEHYVKKPHDALLPEKKHAPLVPAKTAPPAEAPTPEMKHLVPVPVKENIYLWYIKMIGVCLFSTATMIFILGQVMR